jgi:uncharacterized CHY-type Zn-finger protein
MFDFFDHVNYNSDGSPKRCYHCKYQLWDEQIVAIDAGCISEYKIVCIACDAMIGYWAYGHYDPCFANTHPTEGP